MNRKQKHGKLPAPPAGWFRVALALLLVAGCVFFIWYNSTLSPAESARQSQRVADFLARLLGGRLGWRRLAAYVQAHARKIAHAVEFFSLGTAAALMLATLRRVTWHTALHASFLVLCVAVTDEAIQMYTGRGSAVRDILLDFSGGMAGMLSVLALRFLLTGAFCEREGGRGKR
ncbi:MAG: VanZ family protein [Firmicutes bacterium]|nr:VanZ family protein [Bacillota bacterium]